MDIILYTTHCPRCKVLEKKLQLKNIEYTINDNIEEMLALDMLTVPILSVDGENMEFSDAINWINSIGG